MDKTARKASEMRLLEWFCHVDDFCQDVVPGWEQERFATRQAARTAAFEAAG